MSEAISFIGPTSIGEGDTLLSYTELFFGTRKGTKGVTAKYKIGETVQHK